MSEEEKKAIMLLKSLIFHYHGLDEDEQSLLNQAAEKLDARNELQWANTFIADDYLSAFERSREFLSKVFNKMTEEDRLKHLLEVWEDNYEKGYVTEMETTAMLNLAKDWNVEMQFMKTVRS
ncbi:MAG: hypothetical protein RIF46_00435 [Cyclobacteriaceae bacterium]